MTRIGKSELEHGGYPLGGPDCTCVVACVVADPADRSVFMISRGCPHHSKWWNMHPSVPAMVDRLKALSSGLVSAWTALRRPPDGEAPGFGIDAPLSRITDEFLDEIEANCKRIRELMDDEVT